MSSLEKALLTNTITGERIPVMFNPEEYSLNKDINYAQAGVPGLSAPILQFVHGNMQTLEMELFLDTFEAHRNGSRTLNAAGADVRTLTRKITDLMNIDATTHAPPILIFTWGSLTFTCVLARANQRFVMFLPDGTPVRARIQVSFHEFRNVDMEAKEIKRETGDFSKSHTVTQGETLSGIATQVYGDPALWRPIGIANQVENPRELSVGMQLRVPQLPFRDPESGEIFDLP